MPITADQITIAGFKKFLAEIVSRKEKAGITALLKNPPDLLDRAKAYGIHYKNGSWGWCSNIWHRSAAQSVVVEDEESLAGEHRSLMLSVLEHILRV